MSKVNYIKCDICGDILTESWGNMSVKARVLEYGVKSSFIGFEWFWKDAHICSECVTCIRKMRAEKKKENEK